MELLIKRYDGLIRVYSLVFMTSFHVFASRCVIIFAMVCQNQQNLESKLIVFLSIHSIRFLKIDLNLDS
jgi:hypothetical protein